MVENRAAGEPAAKASLLNFLRGSNRLTRKEAVTTELILNKHSVRADLALSSKDGLHYFEIKTERDTLSRLDNQVSTYAAHGESVTVVAATKHINAVLSRVPDYVGIYEMLPRGRICVVRDASASLAQDTDLMLSILPVSEMVGRLGLKAGLRTDVLHKARLLTPKIKRAAVLSFFRDRYSPTTIAFLRASQRRAISPEDLVHLRRWTKVPQVAADGPQLPRPADVICPEISMYRHIGKSFSAVPDDVRRLLLG